MARYGKGRGTRLGKGTSSGTTITTVPSGITISKQGVGYSSGSFVTPTEIGYLDAAVGYPTAYGTAAYRWEYGTADADSAAPVGASSILRITFSNITTLYAFWPSILYNDQATSGATGKSGVSILTWEKYSGNNGVTVYAFTATGYADPAGQGPIATFDNGTSCVWLAFGT